MIKKIVNFGFVGVIATLVDYILLYVLKEFVGLDVMLASTISFSCSLILNYYLSMKYVFVDTKELTVKKQFLIFLITALIGLGINQFVMYILTQKMTVYYLFAKVIATGIVLVWNFISRHVTLEKKKLRNANEENME